MYREKLGQDGRAWCFVGVLGPSAELRGGLGIAEYGVGGYTPLICFYDTFQDGYDEADRLNAALGVSDDHAMAIIADTMKRPAGMVR